MGCSSSILAEKGGVRQGPTAENNYTKGNIKSPEALDSVESIETPIIIKADKQSLRDSGSSDSIKAGYDASMIFDNGQDSPVKKPETSSRADPSLLKKGGVSFRADVKAGAEPEAEAEAAEEPHAKHGRARRKNRGLTAVQHQLRSIAQQGAGHQDDTNLVGDSDDEETDDLESMLVENEAVCLSSKLREFMIKVLQENFVFSGLSMDLLIKVVNSMGRLEVQPGDVIVEQGSLPSKEDCMYVLQEGVVDIVIAGGGQARRDDVGQTVEGHTIRIQKGAGWVFGDMTLLLNTRRSASVHANTKSTLWMISRSTFLALVMKHAEGARAVRFAWRLPLLKGLSDNAMFDVAERLEHETYQDGEPIIKYGEKGEKMYIIRYGEVKVRVPEHVAGEEIELARLGRGHFLGERTLITNKLRTADCVAVGPVKVLVMYKKDFLQLDSPLLGWMRDYEAMASVLKSLPALQGLTSEQVDFVIDKFQREEFVKDDVVGTPEDYVSRISVVSSGSLVCMDSNNYPREDYIKTNPASPHAYFGEDCLDGKVRYPGNILVTSESATLLTIPRRVLFQMLSTDGSLAGKTSTMMVMTAAKMEMIQDAMGSDKVLKDLTGEDIETLFKEFEVLLIDDSDQLIAEGEDVGSIFFLERGAVRVQGNPTPFYPGSFFGVDQVLTGKAATKAVIADGPARLLELSMEAAEQALGFPFVELIQKRTGAKGSAVAQIDFQDLMLHRVVGKGQFGAVRMVSNKSSGEVYALKSVVKAVNSKRKMVEHLHNERTVMDETNECPFCVTLLSAYQDSHSLYMLQEWAAGGEMFNLLNVLGVFDEKLAKFYTACVILAYEHVHARGIVYRDLKPENLLLDGNGYLKMADFGLAKKIGTERTHTICGTPDYQSPEAIMHKGQGPAADWWALGVLIYEMIVGDPPFTSMTGDPWDTFRAILSGRFAMPDTVPKLAADLIYRLLRAKPEERLGCTKGGKGAEDLMAHPWFDGFDWESLRNRTMTPPFIPKLRNPLDTSHFDEFGDDEDDEIIRPPADEISDFSFALWEWIDDVPT